MIIDLYRLYLAHKNSKLIADDFLLKYKNELRRISIGCSFSTEYLEYKSGNFVNVVDAAKFIVEELGVKEIRLSIRWDKVWDDGNINFAYYEKVFRYFLTSDVNICLNVGPIKTMRWPEEHLPLSIINNLNALPAKGSVLKSSDELSGISKQYLTKLLKFLKEHFSESELAKIKSFQTNNEAFNRFGNYQWTIDLDLESEFIELVDDEFPTRKLLLNSSGRNNMSKNLQLIKRANLAGNKFTLGYNYYYKVPGQAEIPIINKFDNLIITFPFSIRTQWLKRFAKRNDVTLEVSELQAEPWQHITSPGNSIREFKFTLIRSIQEMLNLNSHTKSVIRFWGIEELCMRHIRNELNCEHKEIIKLIQTINQKN